MSIANCEGCGQLFYKSSQPICPACLREEVEGFEKVQTYLSENPGASIQIVEKETGVSQKLIMKFIRHGRLDASHLAGVSYPCMYCGTSISTGKVCTHCQENIRELQKKSLEDNNPQTKKRQSGFFTLR